MASNPTYSDVPEGFDVAPSASSPSYSDAPEGFTAAPAEPKTQSMYLSNGDLVEVPTGLSGPEFQNWVATRYGSAGVDDESTSAYLANRPVNLNLSGTLNRGLQLGVRSVVNAISGLPQVVANAATVPLNAINRLDARQSSQPATQAELPGDVLQNNLDQLGMPRPHGAAEHIGDIMLQAAIGSKLPQIPVPGNKAPEGFVGNPSTKVGAQKAAMAEGYVAPPATTNPSTTNRVLESVLTGKKGIEHAAEAQNSELTQTLAKKALGLHPDIPLNPDVVKQIFAEQADAMKDVANAGFMKPDKWYTRALDDIQATSQKSGKFAEVLKDTGLESKIEGLKNVPNQFTADSAVAAIKQLRELKSDAYAQGNATLGDAYRKASDAIENLIQRNLERKANLDLSAEGAADSLTAARQAAQTLAKFKSARVLMAKAGEVERAMNPTTGEINALKLAKSPNAAALTDQLATIRDAANTFPKVMGPVKGSGAVSQLEGAGAIGTALATKDPGFAGIPVLRDLFRQWLLSKSGQSLLAQPPEATVTAAPNADAAQGAASGVAAMFQ